MVYFTFNLMIHLSISSILVVFILRFATTNKKRKNTKGISFLFPVALSVIFLFHATTNTFPKLADTVSVYREISQPLREGEVESVSFFNNTLVMDGVKYFYNPFIQKPKKGENIKLYCSPHSRYIVKLLPTAQG